MHDYKQFWVDNGLANIVPQDHGPFPEGWDPRRRLTDFFDFTGSRILDYGCGYGRLSSAFHPDWYLGLDLNPEAVERAREENHEHAYSECNIDTPLPECDVVLAYTVFNHIDTDTLRKIYSTLRSEFVLNCEILNGEHPESSKTESWGGEGPMSQNKSLDTYKEIFDKHELVKQKDFEYKRYSRCKAYAHRNVNISFLLWRSKNV